MKPRVSQQHLQLERIDSTCWMREDDFVEGAVAAGLPRWRTALGSGEGEVLVVMRPWFLGDGVSRCQGGSQGDGRGRWTVDDSDSAAIDRAWARNGQVSKTSGEKVGS